MDIGGLQESEDAIDADSSLTITIVEQEEGAEKINGVNSTFSYVVSAIQNETLRNSIGHPKVSIRWTSGSQDMNNN